VLGQVLLHALVPCLLRVGARVAVLRGHELIPDVVVLLEHHLGGGPVRTLALELGKLSGVAGHGHGLSDRHVAVLDHWELAEGGEALVVPGLLLPRERHLGRGQDHDGELGPGLEAPVKNLQGRDLGTLEVWRRRRGDVRGAGALALAQSVVHALELGEGPQVQPVVQPEVDHAADGDIARAHLRAEEARRRDLALEHREVLGQVLLHALVPCLLRVGARVAVLRGHELIPDVVVLLEHHLGGGPVRTLALELGKLSGVAGHGHGLPHRQVTILEHRQLAEGGEALVISGVLLPVKVHLPSGQDHDGQLSPGLHAPVVDRGLRDGHGWIS